MLRARLAFSFVFFFQNFKMQIESNAQRQPGDSKDIVRLLQIAAEPEFMFKFTRDREWSKNC